MPLLLFLVAALTTVDAPRVRGVVRAGPDARAVAALGAAVTLAGATVVAVAAEPLLDVLSISPATWRIATGLLLVATGLLAVGGPGPGPEPGLAGRRAALVPVAFPTLATPGLGALVIAGSVDLGVAAAVLGTALGLVPLPLLVPTGPEEPVRRRVLDGVGRLLAGGLVLVGFALLFDGVFDI